VGIGPLKTQHVPTGSKEDRLGEAHTRLLLKGARRSFLWQLGTAIETVRSEEIAAAGAIPLSVTDPRMQETKKPNDVKHEPKGVEGLVRKADLSQYMHNLTEKQQLAFSLKFEYELGLAEIALRMGLDRKTAYEHIEAANRKLNQVHSGEKRKGNRAKGKPE
jgi:DNA-directed RNA polymerase specialized sigma24 family protein